MRRLSRNLSILALVLAHGVPVLGVVLHGWDLFTVMLIYWIECAVIGFYNCLKILVVTRRLSVVTVPFFLFHYGAFMGVHFMFLVAFFGPEGLSPKVSPLAVLGGCLGMLWPAVLSLLASHGVVFIHQFLQKREFRKADGQSLLHAPYRRVLVGNALLMGTGFAAVAAGAPLWAPALVVALKAAVDFRASLRERPVAVASEA